MTWEQVDWVAVALLVVWAIIFFSGVGLRVYHYSKYGYVVLPDEDRDWVITINGEVMRRTEALVHYSPGDFT